MIDWREIMSPDTLLLIVILLFVFATFVFVVKIYAMHNIKNEKGEYAWIIPSGWSEVQADLARSHEKVVEAIAELSVINKNTGEAIQQHTKLARTMTDTFMEVLAEMRKEK